MNDLKYYPTQELPYCRIHGRTDRSMQPLPLFWTGSGLEVLVNGTELWIDLEVDFDFHEPWAAYRVDGALMGRQMLLPGRQSLCLFRNMSPEAVKDVFFFRELQAMSEDPACRLLVHGFKTDGTFFPVPDRPYKLEFIGDSITSGEGTYGAVGDQPWIPMFMSASRHYAAMTAQALNADFRLISQGGWGVVCGWDNNSHHALPLCYRQICGLACGPANEALGAQKPNPFEEWRPDAVIVNLGTNDNGAFDQPAWQDESTGETFQNKRNPDGSLEAASVERFEQGVIDFLKQLRSCNPDAHIVWAYGMLGYELTLPIAHALDTFRKETGDTRISFLQLPNTTEETIGSRFHPGVRSHERAAGVLSEYLKSIL